MRQKQKKIFQTISGIIAVFAAAILIQHSFFKTPSLDPTLVQTANEINKNCPVLIDQATRLENVSALPNRTFRYNYTLINAHKDSLDIPAFENYMKPLLTNSAQTNPDLQAFREYNVTIVHHYNDREGTFITQISLTPDQYTE